MTQKVIKLLGLDVGEKRIGLSLGDSLVKIAFPIKFVQVDGNEFINIDKVIKDESVDLVIVGYPRNQQGEATAQTRYVEAFVQKLKLFSDKIIFQDESLTSVMAEERLLRHGKKYQKSDIDSQSATIILQDYIEQNYAK